MALEARIEPLASASAQLRRSRAAAAVKTGTLITKSATFDEAFAEFATAQIERVAELIDLLETYAVAEVDVLDAENEIEALGFVGYELWIDLDVALHEVSPEPHEMFFALYELFSIGKESALYSLEVVEDDEPVTVDTLLRRIATLAEEAGFDLYGDAPKEPVDSKEALSKGELFFLTEAELSWPANAAAVKKAWKTLAARYHPDRDPSEEATVRFRIAREAYEKLLARI